MSNSTTSPFETINTLLSALRFLAARCDGAEAEDGKGFNKPDAWLGRKLSEQPTLSEEQVLEAFAILKKYQKSQLASAGITLPDESKAIEESQQAELQSGKIDLSGDLLVVTFPYNPRLIGKLKAVEGWKRWNGLAWEFRLKSGKDLIAAFPKFTVTATAKKAIDDYQPPAVEYGGTITLKDKSVIVAFEYNPTFVEAIKSVSSNPRPKFNDNKTWTVPAEAAALVIKALPTFKVDPAISDLIAAQQIEAERQKVADEKIAAELSKAEVTALPNGRILFKHQVEGVRRLLHERRAILADDMGLGKTLQALVAAKSYNLPVIVIAPASLLINWQREAAMVGVDITTHSWGKIPADPGVDFVLIADEAHYAQNLKSARTKAFLALALSQYCIGCYPLTGTPIKNGRPVNLYPLLVAIRSKLAENRRVFELRYCNAHATRFTKWDISGASNLDELHVKTKSAIIRRLKAECLDLPEKTRVIREAELTTKAEKQYDKRLAELRKEYQERIEKGMISGNSEALVMLNHVRHAASVAKAESAIEIAQEVNEQAGQIVIFVAFKESGEQIATALGCSMLSGDASKDERQSMVDRFQAGTDKALVCTFGAGGVGITLTAAQTVVLVDRPWTPGDAVQAEDRLHRIGQQSAVTAIWLQHGDTDKAIDELLQAKTERIELVLAGKRKTMRGTGSPAQIAQELLPEILG